MMTVLIIYLCGIIPAFIMNIHGIYRHAHKITLGDLFLSLFFSIIGSWFTFAILFFMEYGNTVIFEKKEKPKYRI